MYLVETCDVPAPRVSLNFEELLSRLQVPPLANGLAFRQDRQTNRLRERQGQGQGRNVPPLTQGLAFGIWRLGVGGRVKGLGSRVQNLEFRDWG